MLGSDDRLKIPISLSDMPSRGLMYPEGTYFKGRFLDIAEVKFLSLVTPATARPLVDEILQRCVETNLPFESLALCDRTYLVFWLRANSFMRENGYRIKIAKCPGCGKPFDWTVKLDDIPVKQLKDRLPVTRLPKSGEIVKLRLPTVKELSITDEDEDMEYVSRMVDRDDAREFVLSLRAMDYAFLLHLCKSLFVGFDMDFEAECPHCHSRREVRCVISEENLFGQIGIREVISLTAKITKYLTMQIPDTMAWPEFEMLADVTNKMIKDENEEIAKQEAAAKAKASAAKSHVRTPSYRK